MADELVRIVSQEYLPNRQIVRMGRRYYIQLPTTKNKLWKALHDNRVPVDVLLTWSWSRGDQIWTQRSSEKSRSSPDERT